MVAADWLALTEEAALEPELPIIDPHHHLWERPNNTYLLDDLVEDVSRHNVRQTVFIECTSMYRTDGPAELRVVGETEFVEGVANASAARADRVRACTGIVGTANLQLGSAVASVLDAHLEASPTRFRGIRHRAAWDADPDLHARATSPEHVLLDPKFREGYALLERYNLTFEAWLYHPQIAEITDLARAFPNTTIILNHLGGPLGVGPYVGQHDAIFEAWRPAITELASLPNVVAKVGGIQMVINGFGWEDHPRPPSSDELLEVNRRWYDHTIEAFGPDRCMFESNFPVDKASCSYTVLWNQFKKLTAGYSATERAAMFHDTAARVYRLETV
ncbi:MAG: amidohydrolase family protein [Chloroflexi bacterium]|nr:amidohydrolase family protein [Chloroflexota bacterium]MDA1146972.1 amidohydrolase family protein [Chloroflexota bacterium]